MVILIAVWLERLISAGDCYWISVFGRWDGGCSWRSPSISRGRRTSFAWECTCDCTPPSDRRLTTAVPAKISDSRLQTTQRLASSYIVYFDMAKGDIVLCDYHPVAQNQPAKLISTNFRHETKWIIGELMWWHLAFRILTPSHHRCCHTAVSREARIIVHMLRQSTVERYVHIHIYTRSIDKRTSVLLLWWCHRLFWSVAGKPEQVGESTHTHTHTHSRTHTQTPCHSHWANGPITNTDYYTNDSFRLNRSATLSWHYRGLTTLDARGVPAHRGLDHRMIISESCHQSTRSCLWTDSVYRDVHRWMVRSPKLILKYDNHECTAWHEYLFEYDWYIVTQFPV